ncbi:uncharacterized protein LOC117109709 isoform X2 [Anneissia japonica]|uniref:uncharacterized protein LOC117109709 isoform X2 n=1 Tax=Anneissia japonica TaxID=1529436 RepID=UPI001425981B|nr:uncharacterized protein LOC117109709 isoform X2 [Anneissia japonica]
MFDCLIKQTDNTTRYEMSNEFDNDKRILWFFVDVIVSVACIISIVGNLLIVTVYHTMKKIRIQSRRILTINLALADTWMALAMFIIATGYSFEATTVDVKKVSSNLVVVIVVYTVGHFASFFLLFLLAVDTWKSYHDPLSYNRTTMTQEDVRVMCVIVWIFSACLSSAFFVDYAAVCVLLAYDTFLFLMSVTFSCIQLSVVCASQIRRRQQKRQQQSVLVHYDPDDEESE